MFQSVATMDESSKKSQGKKVKRLYIRISEEEYKMLKERSKSYTNLSAFVLDAAKNYDTRKGRNRIDTMIKFSELAQEMDTDLCRIGNNINQIAKEIHRKRIAGLGLSEAMVKSFFEGVSDANIVLVELLKELRKLSNTRR